MIFYPNSLKLFKSKNIAFWSWLQCNVVFKTVRSFWWLNVPFLWNYRPDAESSSTLTANSVLKPLSCTYFITGHVFIAVQKLTASDPSAKALTSISSGLRVQSKKTLLHNMTSITLYREIQLRCGEVCEHLLSWPCVNTFITYGVSILACCNYREWNENVKLKLQI